MTSTAKLLLAILGLSMHAFAFAGGEMIEKKTQSTTVQTQSVADELVQHTQSVTEALRISREEAAVAIDRERTKYDRLTVPIAPSHDRFGDPLYSHYGPRPYAGSPNYIGPAYTASFERSEGVIVPDGTYRGYYRGVYSHPTMHAKSDFGLREAATHSYFQSGMVYSPGSQAPQGDRAMMFNRQLSF